MLSEEIARKKGKGIGDPRAEEAKKIIILTVYAEADQGNGGKGEDDVKGRHISGSDLREGEGMPRENSRRKKIKHEKHKDRRHEEQEKHSCMRGDGSHRKIGADLHQR